MTSGDGPGAATAPGAEAETVPGPVLMFDSGIGGLGILRETQRLLPEAEFVYLADNAGFPYGRLDDDDLTARILALMAAAIPLVAPRIVVVACNTASTVALAALRKRFPDQLFVGCVPAVKWAAAVSKSRTIGLLATPATLRREYTRDLIRAFAPDCRFIGHGSQTLAGLAEAKFRGDPIDRRALHGELAALFEATGGEAIDTVILACTHYPFLIEEFRALAPAEVAWLDPAEPVARRTRDLFREETLAGLRARGEIEAGTAIFTAAPGFQDGQLKRCLEAYGLRRILIRPLLAESPGSDLRSA